MKKIISAMLLVIFGFLLISTSSTPVKAANSDTLEIINYYAEPVFLKSNRIRLTVILESDMEIKYWQVRIKLANNKEEIPYQTGNQNIATMEMSEKDGKFEYRFEANVNNDKLGTFRMTFGYSDDTIGTNLQEYICYLKWGSLSVKKPATIAILVGIIITICASIATYVIIENSQRDVLGIELENEDGDDDFVDSAEEHNKHE